MGPQERRGAVGPLPSARARADRDYRRMRTKAVATSARASRPSIGKESVGTTAVTTKGVGVLVAVGVAVATPTCVFFSVGVAAAACNTLSLRDALPFRS